MPPQIISGTPIAIVTIWATYEKSMMLRFDIAATRTRFPITRIVEKAIPESKIWMGSIFDTYQVLDPNMNKIRILNIAPGTGDEIIECELQHISLDDPTVTYQALSYT
ncbi:hypothetical protein BDZ45DRAFT_753402 [Acephala macrosclerotiorum]|nr:hypothetical protein BDZ45DRAFT_753402 [Acephala macrosclerotiorum]